MAHIEGMRIGPVVTLLSSTFGLPEASVTLVARAMREAGWISTGARGVNAPDMRANDVARLTLALLTGEPPGKVVSEFELIRALQTEATLPDRGIVFQGDLPEDHTLEDMVTALFEKAFDGQHMRQFGSWFAGRFIWPSFTVSVDASIRSGEVRLAEQSAVYTDLHGANELDRLYQVRPMTLEAWARIQEIERRTASAGSLDVVAGRGMRVVRSITQYEVALIASKMGSAIGEAPA